MASIWLFSLRGRAFHTSNFLELRLQAQLIKALDRQCRESPDALEEHPVGFLERQRSFALRTRRSGWIGNPPMACDRFARPHRTCFPGGVVANREDKIDRRRAGFREF